MKHLIASVLLLCAVLNSGLSNAYDRVTYIHSDGQGSPIAASDDQGNLEWRAEYYPFGAEFRNTEIRRENNTSFSGKPLDEEIGLSYFGARHYDPLIGRFTSIDPVPVDPEDYLTFNRYAYANNNPYKYVDPNGELPFLIPVAIFLGKEIAAELASRATGGATDFLSARRLGTKIFKKGFSLFKSSDTAKRVDLNLKYKDGWSEAQKLAADAKCQALCNANTVVTQAQRSGTSAASRYKRAGNTVSSGNDVDHIVDLQLGGADTVSNMLPLNSSVNRSLGAQIHHQIKNLPVGTVVRKVNIR